jgi:dynein heavy chain
MLVGETGSGKTTCYEILSEVMTKLRADGHPDQKFQKVTTNVLNPKCITMGELFGDVNEFTKEWQDGLASMIMRDLSMRDSEDANWVVFDGPVDAMWIENMNTVLDDNMMLCLANG